MLHLDTHLWFHNKFIIQHPLWGFFSLPVVSGPFFCTLLQLYWLLSRFCYYLVLMLQRPPLNSAHWADLSFASLLNITSSTLQQCLCFVDWMQRHCWSADNVILRSILKDQLQIMLLIWYPLIRYRKGIIPLCVYSSTGRRL